MKLFILGMLFLAASLFGSQENRKVIIDADTANEVDDLFAITRALVEPGWEVVSLNSTQWQASQWAVENTMEASHRLNQALVTQLNMPHVKICRGSINRMFDWGNKAQHSEAAYEIIKQAHATKEGQKLPVITLGALTNVASAIWIDPSIKPKIAIYWLGTTYNFETGKSKTIDFNSVMDIQAVDVLLNSDVEMHIIPNNVAAQMKVKRADAEKQLKGVNQAADFLLGHWAGHYDTSMNERTLWDLALIGAMIHPEKTKEVKAKGFENPNIWMFSEIDAPFFWNDFVKKLSAID